MTTISAVTRRPTAPQRKSDLPVKLTSPTFIAVSMPTSPAVSGQSRMSDNTPVAIRPLYSAPMIDWLLPSRTKYVPIIEVITHMAPMASGYSIMSMTRSPPAK